MKAGLKCRYRLENTKCVYMAIAMEPTREHSSTTDSNSRIDVGQTRFGFGRARTCYLLPRTRVELAKSAGTCFDYQKHYGEPPPAWHITEARGVDKEM